MNLKLFIKYCLTSVLGAAVSAVEQHWAIVIHYLKSHWKQTRGKLKTRSIKIQWCILVSFVNATSLKRQKWSEYPWITLFGPNFLITSPFGQRCVWVGHFGTIRKTVFFLILSNHFLPKSAHWITRPTAISRVLSAIIHVLSVQSMYSHLGHFGTFRTA